MLKFMFAGLLIFVTPANQTQSLNSQTKEPPLNILNTETQIFINSRCELNDSCDLKWARLTVKNWEINIGGEPSYGTTMTLEYETSLVKDLENYGFVQFIRGCVFDSEKSNTGIIEKHYAYVKEQFGRVKTFVFPNWVIDSLDKDPFFAGNSKLGRVYFYRWNQVDGSTDLKTEKYYGEETPVRPRLYVKDIPGSSFFIDSVAKNTSLEFKICLYKSKNIPAETTENNLDFAAPIYCFYWTSSHIYSHEKNIFETRVGIDPFCEKCPETP